MRTAPLSLLVGLAAPAPTEPPFAVHVVDTAGIHGLSGLTVSGPGRVLAVAERMRALVEFDLPRPGDAGRVRRGVPLRLEGVEADEETEDIAALSQTDRFVLVTERQSAGATDESLLFAERRGETVVVTDRLRIDLRATWGLAAAANAGLEGVCAVGDHVVAVLETVVAADGGRAAPVAIVDRRTRTVTASRVLLTSDTGKLSALACRKAEGPSGALEITAIERHYGVGRLVDFTLDPEKPAPLVRARVRLDFSRHLDPLPNPEGLVRSAEQPDRFYLITDDDSGRGIDVTRLITLDAPPPP
ncbi:hypothetical protein L6V77_15740 [Myxococcota bacterium]|nr:hypothetical protein [Myxococcota bacterium]